MNPDPSSPEHSALRAALERQAGALAPVASHLHAATVHPPIAPHDWRGPAAQAYRDLEDRLRSRLVAAEAAAAEALHSTRLALAHLGS